MLQHGDDSIKGMHSKNYSETTLGLPIDHESYKFSEYYHPTLNPTPSMWSESEKMRNKPVFPDYKLNTYLESQGIDITALNPGDPIPIKEDPYFAGMAFEGVNSITGAFNAHRFEFMIKKTKSHINHFRQSYEYNLPGQSPHRADTLRPIGYGLLTNHYGFDALNTPPPAAHSYFDGRQLGGGMSLLKDNYWEYTTGDHFSLRYNDGSLLSLIHI